MPVYDDQEQKHRISDDELRRITGTSADEEKAMEREAHNGAAEDIGSRSMSPTEIADKESHPSQPKSGKDNKESGILKEDDDWGKPGRSKKLNKWKAAGGITGIGVGGVFALFSILQGPAAVIQAGKILSGIPFAPNFEATNSRMGRLYERIRANRLDDQSVRNIGYFGEKLTNKFKADLSKNGIEMEFEDESGDRQSRRLQRLKATTPQAQEAMRKAGYDVETDGTVKNKDGSPLNGARDRRRALYAAYDSVNRKGRIVSAVSKRMLAVRAGVDFHPFRNIARDVREEGLRDYYNRKRTERAEKNRKGADTRARPLTKEDSDDGGDSDSDGDSASDRVTEDGNKVADDAKNASDRNSRKRLSARLTRGGSATVIVGALCAAKAIGDSIDEYQHVNIVVPMLRMAAEITSMGSQIQAGEGLHADEVGEVYDTFYDEENGSLFGAAGMQAITPGQEEITGPDTEVKPSEDGDKPVFFDIINNIWGLGAACSVNDGIGKVFDKLTFGLLGQATSAAVNTALGVFGTSEEKIMDQLVSVLAGDVVDVYAIGAKLGNIVAIGSRLAANEAAIAAGGTVISESEVDVARQNYIEDQKAYFASLPLTQRLFDYKISGSLANHALVRMPYMGSVASMSASIRNIPSLFSNFFGSLTQTFMPKAQAQQARTTFDFGVPAYGHPINRLEGSTYEDLQDPYEVAEYVEGRLAELNETYGKCFGTTIDPENFTIQNMDEDKRPKYTDLKSGDDYKVCRETSKDREFYATYLLDQWTFKSAACYEGIDDDSVCGEIGFDRPASLGGSNGSAAGSANPDEDTSSYSCPEGTEDGGIHQDYGPGMTPTAKIRICGIPGAIPANRGVNVSIAEQTLAMIEAMKADGLSPSGSAFRSYESQVSLRRSNCPDPVNSPASSCTPATAKPGTSYHEVGLAIDFNDMCYPHATCSPGSNARYDWLQQNAANYGFTKLNSEAWHWSVGGK